MKCSRHSEMCGSFFSLLMGIRHSQRCAFVVQRQPIVLAVVLLLLLNVLAMVDAMEDDMEIMKVAPDASSMYDEFERTLDRLSDYARDRFDSSRRSPLSIDANVGSGDEKDNGAGAMDAIKNANGKRFPKRVQSSDNDNTNDDQADDDFVKKMRPSGLMKSSRGEQQPRLHFSDRIGKVLNVLMPNLAAKNKQTVSDNEHMQYTTNEDITDKVNEQQDDAGQPDVHERERPLLQHSQYVDNKQANWIKVNPKRLQHFAQHRHQLRLQEHSPKHSANDVHLHSRLQNACELCAASSPSLPASNPFRCCGRDVAHDIRHNDDPNNNQVAATNKVKRHAAATNNGATDRDHMDLYRTRELLHANPPPSSSSSSSDVGYPEIVAKTSALLAPLEHQHQPIASAGNPYSDFLNYYDSHHQRQQVYNPQHHLAPRGGGGDTHLLVAPTGDQLGSNIVVHATTNGSLSSSPSSSLPATDYGNNNGGGIQLSTPLTTNASVPVNATTGGVGGVGSSSKEGGREDGGVDKPPSECAKYIDASNTSRVLQRVVDELERIRSLREGQSAPEGAPCSILGSWNSEIIGLRFDINQTTDANSSTTPSSAGPHDLSVRLFDHNPPKRNTLMDTNWSTWGYALHNMGGPFSVTASVSTEHLLATFTGICKTCGGVDTIFGTWSIVHPAKDCGDLQTALETKRDIFRREMMFVKKQHRLEQLGLMNETSSTEPPAGEPPPPSPQGTQSTEIPQVVGDGSQKRIHSANVAVDDYDNHEPSDYY